MKQLKADITALRVDFDVDVFKVDKGVYVLAREQPNQQDFLNFVSPAHSTKSALLEYCKTNFDDVLHYLHPDRDVQWSEQQERLARLEIGKCPLHGEVMTHIGYVDVEKTIYLAECHNPECHVQASTVFCTGTHMTLTAPFKHLVELEQIEQERLKFNREYFEDGCSCIHTAKALQPCPTNMADSEAVAFYEKNCKCSRNYVQS